MMTIATTAKPMFPTGTSRALVPTCAHASLVAVQGTRAPIAAQRADVVDVRTGVEARGGAALVPATPFWGTPAWRPPTS